MAVTVLGRELEASQVHKNNNNTPFYCPPSSSTTITEVQYNKTNRICTTQHIVSFTIIVLNSDKTKNKEKVCKKK